MTVAMQAEIEVQRSTSAPAIPEDDQFQRWADAALAGQPGRSSLAIRIVDEPEARQFNLEYRGKDYATNVLSFPAELPEGLPAEVRQAQLGDLLICAAVVEREAEEQKRPQADHWAHLTVHGILHLLGYDHEQTAEAEVMESLEIEILAALGVPDPYQDIS